MSNVFMNPEFVLVPSTSTDVKIASVAWGWQLGFTVLTASKAGAQALRVWRRTHRLTPYVAMVWAEILSNITWGVLTWLYLNAMIPPSFWLFFVIVILWCIELHCLIQIIVNRLSLLIHSDRRKFWLKWGCFAYICVLNLSVFLIWIPATLQYEPYHKINLIWDRCEKVLYLVLDLALNSYFIYLVKTKLISGGINKYWALFRFNMAMIVVSISMDILIVAMMSLDNPLLYMQFHPVAYMIKLNIEMSMAHLIGKIARSADGSTDPYSDHKTTSTGHGIKLSTRNQRRSGGAGAAFGTSSRADHSKIHFDPTASHVGDDKEDDIRYHAWVSAGPAPGRNRDDGDRDGARTPGLSMVDEETGHHIHNKHADDFVITKDTSVLITSEPVARDDRAPSESSSASTRYLGA